MKAEKAFLLVEHGYAEVVGNKIKLTKRGRELLRVLRARRDRGKL